MYNYLDDEIILLDVPFREKNEAKRLGAKWSPVLHCWYITQNENIEDFNKWIIVPKSSKIYLWTPVYIFSSINFCWRCEKETRVVGLGVQKIKVEQDDDYTEEINSKELICLLYFIDYLPCSILEKIKVRFKKYYYDYSRTVESKYYMNHCEHCGAKLGDFYMYCEPGGSFYPTSEFEASCIKLEEKINGDDDIFLLGGDFVVMDSVFYERLI
jgi:hypothetical protein